MEKIKLISETNNYYRYESHYPEMEILTIVMEKFNDKVKILFVDIKWEIVISNEYDNAIYMETSILPYVSYDDFDEFISFFSNISVVKPNREFLPQIIDLNNSDYGVLNCEMTGDYRKINCQYYDFETITITTKSGIYKIEKINNKFRMNNSYAIIKNPPEIFKEMFRFFCVTIDFE